LKKVTVPFFLALVLTAPVAGAALSDRREPSVRLLDVPFLPQSELLCGGAAAAMVMRYWGARGVRAEDFAPLVDAQAGGIRQSALVEALRARGWTALPVAAAAGSADPLAAELARSRPIVALIEDRPGRYHYVVIVGATGDRIVLHDPALAPFRVLARDAFERSWASTRRWAIVLLPPDASGLTASTGASSSTVDTVDSPGASDPCAALVAEGTRLAARGDREAAGRALDASVAFCPDSASAHLELAGLRFLDQRWREASALAARATALNPADTHAWRLLASSRFVDGDETGALSAWNRVGEPRVDLVRVSGLVRTRHRVVEALVDATPGSLLTAGSLARARRRVAALPAQSGSHVRYRPAPGGLADVDVAVVERPIIPSLPILAVRGARAVVEREVSAEASSVARGGERVAFAWRFWERRPAITIRAETPSLFGVTGLWTLEGVWARQPYAAGGAIVTEERRHAALRFADWVSGATRVEAGAGVDRWRGRSTSPFLAAAVERRSLRDALAARVDAATWLSHDDNFAAGAVRVAWRARDAGPFAFGARGGLEAASARAPLDLWPGAGTGHARAPRLRAHPLLDDGVLSGAAFGRVLAQATVDLERTLWSRGLLQIGAGAFADAARAWWTLSEDPRLQVDLGAGVRLRTPGSEGAIVLELARGLRDGRTAFSAGWARGWPGW
jgi:hypothetical protein